MVNSLDSSASDEDRWTIRSQKHAFLRAAEVVPMRLEKKARGGAFDASHRATELARLTPSIDVTWTKGTAIWRTFPPSGFALLVSSTADSSHAFPFLIPGHGRPSTYAV